MMIIDDHNGHNALIESVMQGKSCASQDLPFPRGPSTHRSPMENRYFLTFLSFLDNFLDFFKLELYHRSKQGGTMHSWTEISNLCKNRPFRIKRLFMPDDDIHIDGDFEVSPLAQLDNDEQIFIASFLKAHGSIKAMERMYGLSYPTIKNRLNKVIESLSAAGMPGMQDVEPTTTPLKESHQDLLAKIASGEMSAQDVIQQIKGDVS
jgi:hypothetical protein